MSLRRCSQTWVRIRLLRAPGVQTEGGPASCPPWVSAFGMSSPGDWGTPACRALSQAVWPQQSRDSFLMSCVAGVALRALLSQGVQEHGLGWGAGKSHP